MVGAGYHMHITCKYLFACCWLSVTHLTTKFLFFCCWFSVTHLTGSSYLLAVSCQWRILQVHICVCCCWMSLLPLTYLFSIGCLWYALKVHTSTPFGYRCHSWLICLLLAAFDRKGACFVPFGCHWHTLQVGIFDCCWI